jgi:hypothetical protein
MATCSHMAKATMGVSEKHPHDYLRLSRMTSEDLLSSNDGLDSSGEVSPTRGQLIDYCDLRCCKRISHREEMTLEGAIS